MAKYFTSDHHFGHSNIIKLANRPFKDMAHMHEEMIRRWNDSVKRGDEVYCLGDFSFYKQPDQVLAILKRLNGQKFLISGNHDYGKEKWTSAFVWIKSQATLTVRDDGKPGQSIIMSHYRMATWPKASKGQWMLHGHSHSKVPLYPGYECEHCGKFNESQMKVMDVGVDAHGFYPWSFHEIKVLMATRENQKYRHKD